MRAKAAVNFPAAVEIPRIAFRVFRARALSGFSPYFGRGSEMGAPPFIFRRSARARHSVSDVSREERFLAPPGALSNWCRDIHT